MLGIIVKHQDDKGSPAGVPSIQLACQLKHDLDKSYLVVDALGVYREPRAVCECCEVQMDVVKGSHVVSLGKFAFWGPAVLFGGCFIVCASIVTKYLLPFLDLLN